VSKSILRMTCDTCDGHQMIVDDDTGETNVCWDCDGKGHTSLIEYVYIYACSWIDVYIWERLSFSRIGRWYWVRVGKYRNARRLTRDRTPFQLVTLHGDRLNRYRRLADILESNQEAGRTLGEYAFRKERRMVIEAELACKMTDAAKC